MLVPSTNTGVIYTCEFYILHISVSMRVSLEARVNHIHPSLSLAHHQTHSTTPWLTTQLIPTARHPSPLTPALIPPLTSAYSASRLGPGPPSSSTSPKEGYFKTVLCMSTGSMVHTGTKSMASKLLMNKKIITRKVRKRSGHNKGFQYTTPIIIQLQAC